MYEYKPGPSRTGNYSLYETSSGMNVTVGHGRPAATCKHVSLFATMGLAYPAKPHRSSILVSCISVEAGIKARPSSEFQLREYPREKLQPHGNVPHHGPHTVLERPTKVSWDEFGATLDNDGLGARC